MFRIHDLLCFTIIVLILGCSRPQALSGPVLVLERERVNLEEVSIGKRIEASLELCNHGDSDLRLSTIEVSCTCSGASVGQSILMPNESTTLKIYAIPKKGGPGSSSVRLLSDCTVHPVRTVVVEWRCVAPIECLDPVVDLGTLVTGESASRMIDVFARLGLRDENPLVIQSAEVVGKHCMLDGVMPTVINNSGKHTLGKLTVRASQEPGYYEERLILTTMDHDKLRFTTKWRVSACVEATPNRISLRRSPANSNHFKGRVIVRSNRTNLALESVTTDREWCSAIPVPINSNSTLLEIMTTSTLNCGVHVGEIQIRVSAPVPTILKIPVSVVILDDDGVLHEN